LVLGASKKLLQKAGIFENLPTGEQDPGLIVRSSAEAEGALEEFIGAIAKHRHPQRDCDPPLI
jgi:catalase